MKTEYTPSRIEQLKQRLHLIPLPIEGGYYAKTYTSSETIPYSALPGCYRHDRPFYGSILYLFDGAPGCFSALHCLLTDEIYHFYLGDPVEMLLLHPDGHSQHVILGPDIFQDQLVQFMVPRGVWQGSRLLPGGHFALMGTTMTPAYSSQDFTLGQRELLLQNYPHEQDLILNLTR